MALAALASFLLLLVLSRAQEGGEYDYGAPNPIYPDYQCIWYGNAGLDPEADPISEPNRILPEVDDKPARPASQDQVKGGIWCSHSQVAKSKCSTTPPR